MATKKCDIEVEYWVGPVETKFRCALDCGHFGSCSPSRTHCLTDGSVVAMLDDSKGRIRTSIEMARFLSGS